MHVDGLAFEYPRVLSRSVRVLPKSCRFRVGGFASSPKRSAEVVPLPSRGIRIQSVTQPIVIAALSTQARQLYVPVDSPYLTGSASCSGYVHTCELLARLAAFLGSGGFCTDSLIDGPGYVYGGPLRSHRTSDPRS